MSPWVRSHPIGQRKAKTCKSDNYSQGLILLYAKSLLKVTCTWTGWECDSLVALLGECFLFFETSFVTLNFWQFWARHQQHCRVSKTQFHLNVDFLHLLVFFLRLGGLREGEHIFSAFCNKNVSARRLFASKGASSIETHAMVQNCCFCFCWQIQHR